MGPLLTGASVLLLVFIATFIWYSNSFFIKKRKQEIGLYLLVGGKKSEIGWMLFYENLLLSLLSLGIGIGLGQVFSMFFSMIVVKVMGFELVVHFTFNTTAIIQTVFVFILIMLFASFQGYWIAHRFQLIDLFQAKNRVQSVIKPSFLLALLAFVLIGFSYWNLLHAYESQSWEVHFGRNLIGILLFLVAGSYFLFQSASGFFVTILQNKKGMYYRWKNLITFTQLKSRLRSNAIILTVISVLNGVTLVAFGFAYTMYYNTLQTLEDNIPFSYQFEVSSVSLNEEMSAVLSQNKDHSVVLDETFEYVMVPGQSDDLENLPGGYHYYEQRFAVIPVSTYNRLADGLDREKVTTLGREQTIMLGRNFIGSQQKTENVGRRLPLLANGKELHLEVVDNKIESLFNYDVQPSVLIVNDDVYQQMQGEIAPIRTRVVNVAHQGGSALLTEQLRAVHDKRIGNEQELYEPHFRLYSFSENYALAQSIYGLLIFVFGFLGLVFLAATGSVIHFKLLTEATEDRSRYKILRNLGLSRKNVKRLIARQTFILFLLPLLVGIGHSSVILGALSRVMAVNFVTPVVICTVIYTLLYGGYYIMTLASMNKLVNT